MKSKARLGIIAVILFLLLSNPIWISCERDEESRSEPYTGDYIGNKNTKVFHYPSCSYLPDPQNRVGLESCEEAHNLGYRACGHCNPCQ